MTSELEDRTNKRRMELEMIRAEQEAERAQEAVKHMHELPEILTYTVEFLCAFAGALLLLIGKPEASAASWLVAIYLKMRR